METMAARVREHATYEDLLQVPENMIAELIDGEVYASPRPGYRHASAASELLTVLRWHLGRPGRGGGWHLVFEPELHLADNVLIPDLAGWRVDRVPLMPDTAAISIVPDWVCEVLSVSTARIDRGKKMPLYARHRVPYAWIVDLDLQVLEVKRLNGSVYEDAATFIGDGVVHAEPFEELEINLRDVWGPLPA